MKIPTIQVRKGLHSLKRPYYVVVGGKVMCSQATGLTRIFADPEAAMAAGRFEVAKRIAQGQQS